MEWLEVLERFMDRWETVMSALITTGIILFLPLFFPRLDFWQRIWSPYPGGWWFFVVFVFSASLMCCKIIKSLPSCVFYIREARENKKKILQYEEENSRLRAEAAELKVRLRQKERAMPRLGRM